MAKTLKMGFAMGGGVSLGSFSGAGLSEAIKQAVLNAGYYKDPNDKTTFTRYDKVVVDVFSGASAGSMALAIMLRGLAHQTDEEIAEAVDILEREGIDLAAPEIRADDLIAAQVVQNIQKKIWTKEINMDRLFGLTDSQREALMYEAGIVRRGALEDIAFNYFQLDNAFASNFERKKILGDEVLFASTLANLTGIIHDGRDKKDVPNFKGTKDPFTSQCHKELRVFHLLFKEVSKDDIDSHEEKYPSKWVRYHMGAKMDGYVSDLKTRKAWSRMVTTSMACGAFPFAFEPVPLERFEFEYGSDTWARNGLDAETCMLAMELDQPQQEGRLSYPFCYVDGGTFNNEPVREAFRMASFLDSEDPGDFDRVVVFVDPSVGSESADLNLPFLKQYTIKAPNKNLGILDGYDVVRNGTLDRLLPHIGTLVQMLTDEGRVKESNKIVRISQLFKEKEAYYNVLDSLLSSAAIVPATTITAIANVIDDILKTKKEVDIVPAGSLTLRGELIKIVKDKSSPFYALWPDRDKFTKARLTEIGDQRLLCQVLFRVFIDLMMDLSGKDPNCKIIAIAPTEKINGEYVEVDLPGGRLAGFAGFASEPVNIYQGDLAKYCTRSLMTDLELLPAGLVGDKPQKPDMTGFKAAFRSKLEQIDERINNLFLKSHIIDIFPVFDDFLLKRLSGVVQKALDAIDFEEVNKQSFRFFIEVSDSDMEIDAKEKFSDAKQFKIGKQTFLITELSFYPNKKDGQFWDGPHAQEDLLKIDHHGLLADRRFCAVNLPTPTQVAQASKMPNPTFVLDKILEDGDHGTTFKSSHWKIRPGLRLPEATLLEPKRIPAEPANLN